MERYVPPHMTIMDNEIMKAKHTPLISVILPTYNRAKVLGESIKSVLDQTFRDFELIVVDDGSNDKTEEVVKTFEDDRIRYISHGINKGAASARNTGIKAAKGEFISMQDSDDLWLSKKIENEIKAFEKSDSNLGVVYTGLYQVDKEGKKTYFPGSEVLKKEGYIHQELLTGNFVNGLSLIKKECFNKVGLYDEKLPGLEDWELYIRISKYYEFKFLDEPLIITKLSQDSLTVNLPVYIDSTNQIIEKHFETFNENKYALAINYGFLGSCCCLDGQTKKGREYYINAIKLKPTEIEFYIGLLMSLMGSKVFKALYHIGKRQNPFN